MDRRSPWRTLFLGLLGLVPAGCEPHRSWLRPKEGDEIMARSAASSDDVDPRKVIGGGAGDQDARSFFQSNRRSGAWSSEAREIERHLGAD